MISAYRLWNRVVLSNIGHLCLNIVTKPTILHSAYSWPSNKSSLRFLEHNYWQKYLIRLCYLFIICLLFASWGEGCFRPLQSMIKLQTVSDCPTCTVTVRSLLATIPRLSQHEKDQWRWGPGHGHIPYIKSCMFHYTDSLHGVSTAKHQHEQYSASNVECTYYMICIMNWISQNQINEDSTFQQHLCTGLCTGLAICLYKILFLGC